MVVAVGSRLMAVAGQHRASVHYAPLLPFVVPEYHDRGLGPPGVSRAAPPFSTSRKPFGIRRK
jgi:hypothetical protein